MHEYFMEQAIMEAKKALEFDEVPVGAVIVLDGEIIGRGFNKRETSADPTAHAEMIAIREAARCLGSWRLTNTRLYVTLEPCPMCAGAIVNARIHTLVYGVADPKAGAVSSLMNLVQDSRLNHRVEVIDGVCRETCGKLLKDFFSSLRKQAKDNQER
ncbi:MAG: tRNA adenosine(34) deaminase TadA [Firmicutes bacterium]|jgi:tRNA(adenine34) deaminase|nr:tRNA adenosine(34) deaminase TadA [Bacillota bacterium]NLL89151.1 tRNA adenosine(34) deaminase TadA [Bacillota bacterium]HKM17942.1 tRNA adenosine(34) deaminase TadA [Limnochordia bacterium]